VSLNEGQTDYITVYKIPKKVQNQNGKQKDVI